MNIKLIITAFCCFALAACTLHKTTDKEQLCVQAQRQQLLNKTSPEETDSYNITTGQRKKLADTIAQNC